KGEVVNSANLKVFRSAALATVELITSIDYRSQHIATCGSSCRIERTCPGINEIVGCYVARIALVVHDLLNSTFVRVVMHPRQVIDQVEGIGQSIGGYIPSRGDARDHLSRILIKDG